MARIGLQKGIKKADPKRYPFLFFYIGRNERIRTSGPYVPNVVLYQAELRFDHKVYLFYSFSFLLSRAFFYFLDKLLIL